jgi:hypothetical protein
MAAPMPLPPPVTNTVRPERLGWMAREEEAVKEVSGRDGLDALQIAYQCMHIFLISVINMP